MRLRNKKTGEIGELQITEKRCAVAVGNGTASCGIEVYASLAELNKDWEDVPEEPKDIWWLDNEGNVNHSSGEFNDNFKKNREIGNYFSSRKEAEKAVEKLKAWKRLKDGGITFKNWIINQTGTIDCFATWGDNIPPSRKDPTLQEDLDLLFGGEK